MKFIHTADWHIGMTTGLSGDIARRVEKARLDAARNVINAAADRAADFILIAGDVFDHHSVDPVAIQQIADLLKSARCPVYIIPGNHDPIDRNGVWNNLAFKACGNARILMDKETLVEINGGTLYPCPLTAKTGRYDPTAWINASAASGIRIGLAHGSLPGANDAGDYFPIPSNAAEHAGLDYLALGHWHSRSDPVAGSRIAYSGAPEPTKFGERDSGWALCITIDSPGATPIIDPVPTGVFKWDTRDVSLSSSGDLRALCDELEKCPASNSTLYRLRLSGAYDAAEFSCLERIDALVASRFLDGRTDASGLFPLPDSDEWLNEIPVGPVRDAAALLKNTSSPDAAVSNPADAATARLALIELFRLLRTMR